MRGSLQKRNGKHGTSYYLKVDTGRDPATGKRRQSNVFAGHTRKEAEAFQSRVLDQLNRGALPPALLASKTTVSEFFREWLDRHPARPITVAGYRWHFERHIEPQIGALALPSVGVGDIERIHAEMRQHGLSDTSIAHAHAVVRAGLKEAMRRDLLLRNVASLVKSPPLARRKVQVPDDDTIIRSLFDYLKRRRLYPAYRLAYVCALRREEVLGLPWRAVDLEGGSIRIEQVLVYCGKASTKYLRLMEPKTELSRRTIAIGPRTVDMLRGWRRQQDEERRRCGSAYQDQGLVFCRQDGAFANPTMFTRNMKADVRHLRAQGIDVPEEWTPHGLRHLGASEMVSSGEDIAVVSRSIGHARTSITLDVYGHHRPNKTQREMVLRREAAIEEALPDDPAQ